MRRGSIESDECGGSLRYSRASKENRPATSLPSHVAAKPRRSQAVASIYVPFPVSVSIPTTNASRHISTPPAAQRPSDQAGSNVPRPLPDPVTSNNRREKKCDVTSEYDRLETMFQNIVVDCYLSFHLTPVLFSSPARAARAHPVVLFAAVIQWKADKPKPRH
jgi:hypothetical protein